MKEEKLLLPKIIKRNVLLFIVGFACLFIGFECGMPVFSKVALEITGRKELVGIPHTLLGLAAIITAIPFGKMADKVGRKLTGIVILLTAGVGLGLVSWAISLNSWSFYLLGCTILGLGLGGNFIFVLAVSDMFPPKRKGEAVGLAFLGMYLGLVIGPFLGGMIAQVYGFAYSFLMGTITAVLGIIVLLMVHTDPLEIGTQLEKYYPRLNMSDPVEGERELRLRTVAKIFTIYPIQVQFWSRILIFGPRIFLTVLSPIILIEAGYSMTWIGFLITVMGLGMFGISFLIGRLADRYGRKKMIFFGALISMAAIAVVVHTTNIVLLGIIFLATGFGFTSINNVAPSMVADTTHPMERGKSMGLFGIAVGIGAVIFPVMSSWIYGNLGPEYIGWAGAVIMLLILFLLIPLREKSPGIYDHAGACPEDIPR
jgi:MFS family permease